MGAVPYVWEYSGAESGDVVMRLEQTSAQLYSKSVFFLPHFTRADGRFCLEHPLPTPQDLEDELTEIWRWGFDSMFVILDHEISNAFDDNQVGFANSMENSSLSLLSRRIRAVLQEETDALQVP